MSWKYEEIEIGSIKTLLEQGYEIEVDSPDGYVPVNFFIDKGEWKQFTLILDDHSFQPVICNADHLFETTLGWLSAKHISNVREPVKFLTEKGFISGKVIASDEMVPIVDINVNHPNSRYYTNGVSSHNTGVGKSLFMCHCAAGNVMNGKNVLYITLEMAEEKIAERIDANLLGVAIDELAILPKDVYEKKVKRLKEKTVGKLIIKEYPTSTAGSSNFRYLLNELKLKKNFIPDIIYIDYLNICISSRIKSGANVNSYTYIKSIAEELRGLAVEYNVPIVSATQTNRTGYTNSDVGLEDTSESFGLPATADFMFAIISNDQLASLNQFLVKQLKNRYSDPNMHRKFIIGVDRSKMRLYNTEQTAQDDIIDEVKVASVKKPSSKFGKDVFQDFS